MSLGNSRWVHAMEWSGQKAFGATADLPFKVDSSEAGLFKTHGPLSFLKVHFSHLQYLWLTVRGDHFDPFIYEWVCLGYLHSHMGS